MTCKLDVDLWIAAEKGREREEGREIKKEAETEGN